MTSTAVSTPDNSAILQSYLDKQKAALAAEKANDAKSNSSGSITGDFNTFLKILTTQLQNQDPLNAQDTNEFTQELVQFSQVEQQINMNSKLDQLVSLSKPKGVTSLLDYVGKYVESGAGGNLLVQDGRANLAYNVSDSFSRVTFDVKDSKGITLASFNGPNTPGEQTVTWDGKLANGTQLKDGTYEVTMTGYKADGTKADLGNSLRLIAKVDAIQTNADGSASLGLGDLALNDSDVRRVYSNYGS